MSGRLRAQSFLPSSICWDCRLDATVWGGCEIFVSIHLRKADGIPVSVWQCEADWILMSVCLRKLIGCLCLFCQREAAEIRVFVRLRRLTGSLCPCVLWEMDSAPPFVCRSEKTVGNATCLSQFNGKEDY